MIHDFWDCSQQIKNQESRIKNDQRSFVSRLRGQCNHVNRDGPERPRSGGPWICLPNTRTLCVLPRPPGTTSVLSASLRRVAATDGPAVASSSASPSASRK